MALLLCRLGGALAVDGQTMICWVPPGLAERFSAVWICCCRGSGRLAFRTCTVRPSRRCRVVVMRTWLDRVLRVVSHASLMPLALSRRRLCCMDVMGYISEAYNSRPRGLSPKNRPFYRSLCQVGIDCIFVIYITG